MTARVPNLNGVPLTEARQDITNAGLTVGRVSYNSTCIDPGLVIAQHPTAGSAAPLGSSVDVTVAQCSSGGGGV